MERQPVVSSQISAVGYDAETQVLEVEFKNAGGKPNSVYQYANFPPEKWAEFQKAESVGSYFYRNIKNNPSVYPYRKVS